MKEKMFVALVMAFLLFMASSSGFAQVTGITDTSKEGSLLVWPLVQTNDGNDTYIMITNSNAGDNSTDTDVYIKCYWEAKRVPGDPLSTCDLNGDTIFPMTRYQPLLFKASDGTDLQGMGLVAGFGDDLIGALKCWAIDPVTEAQIAWNHLSGYAIIVDRNNPKKTAWQYSAWRFAANVVDQNGNFVENWPPNSGQLIPVGKNTADCANNKAGHPYNTLSLNGTVCPNGNCQPVTDPASCPVYTTPVQVSTIVTTSPPTPQYLCVAQLGTAANPCSNGGYSCSGPRANCGLQNAVYDACPLYLTFDFLAEPSSALGTDGFARNYLAVIPCKEDLRQDDNATGTFDFLTRLTFSVWNANEVKYTGLYQCADCDFESPLALVKGNGRTLNFFQARNLHTGSGRFRLEGLKGGACAGAQQTPLLGVMSSRLVNNALASRDLAGTTPTISGPATNSSGGFIKYDPGAGISTIRRR